MTVLVQAQRIIDTHNLTLFTVEECVQVIHELVSELNDWQLAAELFRANAKMFESQVEMLRQAKVNEG